MFHPITVASLYSPGMYPHQRNPLPAVSLIADSIEWHCDECGREGRILRVVHAGVVTCARCESRFVVPVRELC